MKKFFTFILLSVAMLSQSQTIPELRGYLKQGEESAAAGKQLIARSMAGYNKTKLPIYQSFLAVGYFFMAKHDANVLNKYKHFKNGKEQMSAAVRKDPSNVEIRLMRYISQEKAPRVLGYYKDMEGDKNHILKWYKTSPDMALQRYIESYFGLK